MSNLRVVQATTFSAALLMAGCQKSEVRVQTAPPALTNSTSAVAVASSPTIPPAPAVASAPAVPTASVNAEVEKAPEPPKPPVPNVKLSPALLEVVRLAHANVGEEVLKEFIVGQNFTSDLTADEIVFLKDVGLSDSVITSIMHRRREILARGTVPADSPSSAIEVATQSPPPAAAPPANSATPTAVATTSVAPPEAAPALTAPPPQVVNNYFYSSLSPYGTWYHEADYGWCWRPTVATLRVGWRPYCDDGRWLWTSSGWYWQSDYSWGWAPFHYGRWHLSAHHGWTWVPGRVWGPSWVTWRYNSGYCGWAPLPPGADYSVGLGFSYHGSKVSVGFGFGLGHGHYTFVPTGRLHGHHPRHHLIPSDRNVQAYNNSTVINNYINGNNNTIVNGGVSIDEVKKTSREEIRQVEIREVGAGESVTARAERLERNGATLAVFRPQVPALPASPPPPASGQLSRPSERNGRNERGSGFTSASDTGPNAAIIPSLAGIPLTAPANARSRTLNPASPSAAAAPAPSNRSESTGSTVRRTEERGGSATPVTTFVPQRNTSIPASIPARTSPRQSDTPLNTATFPAKREEVRGTAPVAIPDAPSNSRSFERQGPTIVRPAPIPATPAPAYRPPVRSPANSVSSTPPPAASPSPITPAAPTLNRDIRNPGSYNNPRPTVVPSAPSFPPQNQNAVPRRPVPGVDFGRPNPSVSAPTPTAPAPAPQGRPIPGVHFNAPPPRPTPAPAAPSYSPPAAPSRPAPSFSPASSIPARPTPAPAPAPPSSSSSGNAGERGRNN